MNFLQEVGLSTSNSRPTGFCLSMVMGSSTLLVKVPENIQKRDSMRSNVPNTSNAISNNKSHKKISHIATAYNQKPYIRALVQLIPNLGASLDTILSSYGDELRLKRLEDFSQKIIALLEQFNLKDAVIAEDAKEPIFDLLAASIENVVKTRSAKKRACFAQIITKQIKYPQDWCEAEIALKSLIDLTEEHIRILALSKISDYYNASAPHSKSLFIDEKIMEQCCPPHEHPLCLSKEIPQVKIPMLRMLCADLMAKNLIVGKSILDQGINEYFHLSETGKWFLSWIVNDTIAEISQ